MAIDRSAIILGFTGSIGSGCSYISETIQNLSETPYKYCKLSDAINESLKGKGNLTPTVEDKQVEGNSLREKYGNDILASILIDKLKDEHDLYTHIIIDGIKNDHEVRLLRQIPNFYLFSINADRDIREKRVVGEGKPFSDPAEFLKADKKDEWEESGNGQQVKKCNDASDIIVVNEKEIADTTTHLKQDFVRNIYRKYIELIENNIAGKRSPETSPSVNELCMTIAYSLSKKSSCLKRKVGAVIIEEDDRNDIDKDKDEKEGIAIRIPNIVASGYNEVPMGTHKCIFNKDYQKCYRDHLQEEYAKKMIFCPTCGEKINVSSTCPNCKKVYNDRYVKFCQSCQSEIKDRYLCPKCATNVFEEHLPGSKNTPGKLLDLCKALHGEEMAILQLSKRTGNTGSNLILYVTTQPCNLCANKIATAGIKKVVYSEPYKMQEAADILKKGNVTLERFEGVKSSAYFKLYN
ncbi:MAG: deaminase [Pseudomonadota bacterium]